MKLLVMKRIWGGEWLFILNFILLYNECPVNDTKQFDREVPVMQKLLGMRSTPSLPLLPGQLWPGMVAPDSALSMG